MTQETVKEIWQTMTQAQLQKLSKSLYPVVEDVYGDDEVRFERAAFMHGVNSVLDNPTDFGLVSMETMFEFAIWCEKSYYIPFDSNWWVPRGYSGTTTYTTPELFQLFTQNKEK